MTKEEQSKKKEHKIKDLGNNRFKTQRGQMVATFEIDSSGGITFFDGVKSDTVKSFHFHNSEPLRVKLLASAMKDAVNQSKKLQRVKDEKSSST